MAVPADMGDFPADREKSDFVREYLPVEKENLFKISYLTQIERVGRQRNFRVWQRNGRGIWHGSPQPDLLREYRFENCFYHISRI